MAVNGVLRLNEEQYRSLCDACDRVLLAKDSTIERVGISWLHVIREHPVFLEEYVDLFDTRVSLLHRPRQWFSRFRRTLGWVRQLGRACRSKGRLWFRSNELPQRVDVVFVSRLLNASHAGQTDDFYFGDLPHTLAAQGYSVVIALVSHVAQSEATLANTWHGHSVPRVIFSDSLGFSDEVALRRRLNRESQRLQHLVRKEPAGLVKRVLTKASQEALSGKSLSTLRLASQVLAFVATVKPKAIVVTHEGHAWERLAFAAARRAKPDVRCVGYQHAALFRLQHAIRRNLAREYNPDHILTAGTVAQSQLERAPNLDSIPVSVLGSHRSSQNAQPNDPGVTNHENTRDIDRSACLVLPEGIASECTLMFAFSLACARQFPDIQFIWRLHPVLTYEFLLGKHPNLRHRPSNVVLSTATLEEDIAQSRWTLYRGTTAAVPAVMAGSRPVYLRVAGELAVDSLYELVAWRTSVETIADFQHVISGDRETPPIDREAELMVAQDYCGNFFTALNPGVLEAAIR